jgi:tRNA(Arg) A34 adenosine deaminase TadA
MNKNEKFIKLLVRIKMSQFISRAINEAKKSIMQSKHGCVAIYKNKIVARAFNHPNSKHMCIKKTRRDR